MAITQARAAGGHTGKRYGSFAGRGEGAHPVERLTQPRGFGAHTGGVYGAFGGRVAGRPLARITQVRAFGPHTGRRYGAFSGRTETQPPDPGPSLQPPVGRRIVLPPALLDDLRLRRIEEDDMLLLIAAHLVVSGQLH